MSARHDIRAGEPVEPARLAAGIWCHRAEKTLGQGDIYRSYSADRIGMGKPVRAPFTWQGGLWVCVSVSYRDGEVAAAESYRLVDPKAFKGRTLSYAAKVANADAARSDPLGFYHGMSVKRGSAAFVLQGPPVLFVRGEEAQLSLF